MASEVRRIRGLSKTAISTDPFGSVGVADAVRQTCLEIEGAFEQIALVIDIAMKLVDASA
jgi:hypothetical protein